MLYGSCHTILSSIFGNFGLVSFGKVLIVTTLLFAFEQSNTVFTSLLAANILEDGITTKSGPSGFGNCFVFEDGNTCTTPFNTRAYGPHPRPHPKTPLKIFLLINGCGSKNG